MFASGITYQSHRTPAAAAGKYVLQWQVKLSTLHLPCGNWDGLREVECVTALRGKTNDRGTQLDWCGPTVHTVQR